MFSQYLNSHSGPGSLRRLAAILALSILILTPAYPIRVIAQSSPEASTGEAEDVAPEAVPTETAPAEIVPTETPADEGAVIETGDAVAESEVVSEVNTNVVEAETLPEENVAVSTDNQAVVENASETAAETGENTTSSEEGDTTITTGDAYASANVISVANLNLIESNGFLLLLNNFLQSLGHIDLRLFTLDSITPPPNPCGIPNCSASTTSLAVETKNKADILNAVVMRSSTGGNLAQGESDASINTGNAYAGANLVNIANTNIINSNYLLFAFNNFGAWNGDLIFPNADFFSSFFTPSSSGVSAEVSNTNSANVESEVEVSAETGENETEGEGSAIETGAALAGSNVSNIVNTNLFNTPSFFVIFRIFGSWNGSVFNAPEEIAWAETLSGIELFSTDKANPADAEAMAGEGGNIGVKTDNTANIKNKVKVFALTGANRVTSREGVASINTGNAYAGANVLNVVNANIVSSNWIVALINIFGDWSGNISFGQPDIWVATQVETPGTLGYGSEAIFHTTVANRGDARASNVQFNGSFNSPHVNFKDKDHGETYSWEVGNLAPGEIKEFSYSAKASGNLSYGNTLIDHTFEISANETDANPADNSDIVSFLVYRPWPPSRMTPPKSVTSITTYPALHISKTNSATTTITASSTVDYTVVVKNEGGSAFNGVLYDVLRDDNGNTITQNSWELGEIFANEEITLTYTAVFKASTTPGIYRNSAWVEAWGGDYLQDPKLGTDADSNIASTDVIVVGTNVVETSTAEPLELEETVAVAIAAEIDVSVEEPQPPENTPLPKVENPPPRRKLNPLLLLFSIFIFAGMKPIKSRKSVTMIF